jgi:2-furoyl-CoA dehydrogenase large subunit
MRSSGRRTELIADPGAETTTSAAETAVEVRPWVGQSVPRREDRRLLQGQGEFADDVWIHRQGYAHFVRSPHGHARIVSVDTRRALALDGVYAVLTGDEAKEMCEVPFFQIAPEPGGRIEEYPLAVDKVRYHGDAVAVVLAETRELARDAAGLVEVEYEPLPAVVDGVAAADPDATLLHEQVGTNVAWHGVFDWGDIEFALQNADHVVEIDHLHFHRFSSTPLECNGAVVNWDPGTDTVYVSSNNQMPMFASMVIGPTLGVASNRLLFSSQDIGGAFGNKIGSYPQIAALALLSRKAGRPAKWTEYRTDHMLSCGHGNERTFLDTKVAVMKDGTILGFTTRAFDDVGGYLHYEPLGAVIWSQVSCGCYRLKHIHVDYTATLTNKCPTIPNRGYSRLQHLWMIERIIDVVARELGFDPIELRKKNYVQPADYPYETPNGCVYDSGDLPRSLDIALELVNAEEWRVRQRELGRGSGKRIGIGIGSTLDSGTNNFGQARIINPELPFSGNGEAAYVKLDLYGEVNVNLGTTPQGQSHETTAAQAVADVLNMDPDQVHVTAGFNQLHNTYVAFSGTYASQFAVTGLGAAQAAAQKLRGEIAEVAAFALQAEPDEIELEAGVCYVGGDRERAIPFIGVANLIYSNNAALPMEMRERLSLNSRHVYVPPFQVPDPETKRGNLTLTYASQVHACVVEIDEDTGEVKILDYAAVDDCGNRVNPRIVEGQVHGATMLGIGAALYEAFEYDEQGQLQQSSFYEYHAITALDAPDLKTGDIESPSPFTPNGAKGMGEGGGAPLHAICSAIQDALGPEDAIVSDSHNPWERVWRLVHSGERGEPRGVTVTSRAAPD